MWPTAALALALAACAPEAPRRPAHPDVLVYLVDTLRRDHVSLYGYGRDTTPRLAEFARDAVVFEDAYSPSAWTKPAVATLLSGLNPPRHGAITRENRLPPEITLLGERLEPLGYRTAAVGTNPNILPVWGFGQGFGTFVDLWAGSPTEHPGARAVTTAVLEHLATWAAERERRPFFLYVHTMDPHGPYAPPPPWDRRFTDAPRRTVRPVLLPHDAPPEVVANQIALYDGEIAHNDAEFGRLLDWLRTHDRYERTLIVFASDHGEEFRDHGGFGHARTLHQELVRVPLVVKFPGNAAAGRRVAARAGLVDVVPTVLAAVGAERPAHLEGIDLAPLVGDPPTPREDRHLFFDLDVERSDDTNRVAAAVLAGRFKYVDTVSPERSRQLFDVVDDPGERRDLVGEEPERAERLAALLAAYASGVNAGVHLRLVNGPGPRTRIVEGEVTTAGTFAALERVQLEQGDEAALDGPGTLVFRLTLANDATASDGREVGVIDEDALRFRVTPPDATITVARLAHHGGREMPLFVGAARRRAERLPLAFAQTDRTLWTSDAGALFRRGARRRRRVEPGAYLAVVPTVERLDAEASPELRERLRALGYVP
jgi:arylsulfatase A-like enzyme